MFLPLMLELKQKRHITTYSKMFSTVLINDCLFLIQFDVDATSIYNEEINWLTKYQIPKYQTPNKF